MWKCLQIMHVITAFLNELFSRVFPLRFANLHITLIWIFAKQQQAAVLQAAGLVDWICGTQGWAQKWTIQMESKGTVDFHSLGRSCFIWPLSNRQGRSILFRWGVHFLISASSIFSLSNRPVWDMIVNFQSFGMSSWTRSGGPSWTARSDQRPSTQDLTRT